jgi:hypothetical protein
MSAVRTVDRPSPPARSAAPPRRAKSANGMTFKRRSEEAVEALLKQAGLRGAPDAEVEHLVELLMHKFAHDFDGEEESAVDALAVRRAYLHYRLLAPVDAYERGERFYGYLDTALNLTSIASGIAASLAAALVAPKGLTIVLGVVVAACQTFSQWLKPAQRASRRSQAVSELRTEAWNLLQERDRYRCKPFDQAWNIFCAQFDKVEEREDTAQDRESTEPVSSGGNGQGQH